MTNTAFWQAAKAQSANKETLKRYRKIADHAFARFRNGTLQPKRERGSEPNPGANDNASAADIRRFVAWLAERRPHLTKPAFRQIKAAASHRLGELGYYQAKRELEALDCQSCRKRPRRNAKKLSQADYQSLLAELTRLRGHWGRRAAILLTATLATGLRPHEWRDSYYAGRGVLVVRNAKFSNGACPVPAENLMRGKVRSDNDIRRRDEKAARAMRLADLQIGGAITLAGCEL